MKYVYANLIGKWCCLNQDEKCVIGSNKVSPSQWWKEEGDKMFEYDYLNIHFEGVDYRIHPSFVQIITK